MDGNEVVGGLLRTMDQYRADVIVRIDAALAEKPAPAIGRMSAADAVAMVGEFLIGGADRYLAMLSVTELRSLPDRIDLVAERLAGFTYNEKGIARSDGSLRLNGDAACQDDLVKMLGAMLAMEREAASARSVAIRSRPGPRAGHGEIADRVAGLADGSRTAVEVAAEIGRPVSQVNTVVSVLRKQGREVSLKPARPAMRHG
jgi:hypothetical protein